MNDKQSNPLFKLWNIIGTIGGIISLSSMAQNWMDDLVKWKGFIFALIDSYHSLTRPFFIFSFQLIPFDVPFWIHDYLIFGFIIAISKIKARRKVLRRINQYTIVDFISTIIGWPILLITYPKRIYIYYQRKKRPDFVRHTRKIEFTYKAVQWIGAVLFGCFLLLAINSVL